MVLLDDALALAKGQAKARLWRHCEEVWVCRQISELDTMLAHIDAAQRAGRYVVLALSYELGMHLQGIKPYAKQSFPYVVAWLGGAPEMLDEAGVQAYLDEASAPAQGAIAQAPAALVAGPMATTQSAYNAALATIAAQLSAGNTYQVNYTVRQAYSGLGHPCAIYRALRQAQAAPFGACLQWDDEWIVSCSPELFVRRAGNRLTAQPMKGTARASADAKRNAELAQALQDDGKNRSENVMIVDLLRNDLGRIAVHGSVQVPRLFHVEQFGQVLQMTSTVEADCPPQLSWWDVMRHLLPCGSVTGAPKHRAMQIIRDLEPEPRGLYCGALGWLAPDGDFCFSVPIRTLHMDSLTAKAESKPKAKAKVKPMPSSKLHSTQPALVLPAPVRTVHMSVGSGIVLESQAQDEWLELETKRRFVAQAFTTPLGLIETMRLVWSAQHQAWHIPLLPAHLERLSLSAIQLGLAQDRAAVQRQVSAFIQAQLAALAAPSAAAHTEAQRARLVWQDYAPTNSSQSNSAQAALQWQVEALQRPQTPVSLCWAHDLGASAIDPDLALLAHKTTWRQGYTALLAAAQARGCWDAIAINRRGEVCEGARSNILLDLGEVDATGAPLWLTPARTAGLLPGVMRAQLLAGHKVNMPVREAVLTPNDARAARALAVCNALHGVLPAVWVQGQDWASL